MNRGFLNCHSRRLPPVIPACLPVGRASEAREGNLDPSPSRTRSPLEFILVKTGTGMTIIIEVYYPGSLPAQG